ncbi:MAG: aminobenzoyl-glutamate transport protein [Planctomycetota bacterium]|jgi:aminobenzoyl-glutamate transport protein
MSAPTSSDGPNDSASLEPAKKGWLDRVERIGNGMPDPISLFGLGALIIFVASWIAEAQGWNSILLDSDGGEVLNESATSLLSADGFRWLASNLVSIFVEFRPLGLVLAVAIGISVAEKSGFISAALRGILLFVPSSLLTPAAFFAGVTSSMAIDAGYIVLPPLAAAVFKASGRSPLVGIAAVFAGVASGFNANLFITGLDPMLSGLTEQAARIIDPEYVVSPACNWYFMIASTVMLTLVGWAVSAWYVEPRLSRRSPEEGGPGGAGSDADMSLTSQEKSGLKWGFGAMIATFLFVFACASFTWGFLYDEPGSIGVGEGKTPFPTWITSIVPLLIIVFLIPGMAYGVKVGSIRSDRDVSKMMNEYMSILGSYVVLAFFASIFVAAFEHSNLGRMLAIEGGNFLRQFDMPAWVLMLGFIFVSGFINLFVGSMSAKWAMLATVFVPMFMTIGISPELTQVTYRIGDSVTNSITPLNPYLVVVLVFMRQYVKKGGLGTLVAVMLPYAITFTIVWSILLIIWMNVGLPLGPNSPLTYTP